jgi:hypothetical protein
MFPLTIIQYVKLGVYIVLLLGAGYCGYSFEHSRFLAYRADQVAKTQKIEKEYQAQADRIESEKNAQIRNINNSLADALVQLRSRPSRASEAGNGQGGTGLSLSAEDSIFLEREAARADILRTALSACYQQYDSLK